MCSCKGNGIKGLSRNPVTTPRRAGITAQGLTPRQANRVQAQSTTTSNGLSKDRLQREKERREIILKKLGRL